MSSQEQKYLKILVLISWTIYVSCIAIVGKIRFPLRNIWRDELGCPSKWVGGAIDEAR